LKKKTRIFFEFSNLVGWFGSDCEYQTGLHLTNCEDIG
jgi:hypothetical protein